MRGRASRRTLLQAAGASVVLSRTSLSRAQGALPAFSFPIHRGEGELPGDGFIIRHGYAVENTWYNPGWLHTAEDWYLADGAETGGVPVLAIADGTVVYAGADYPGLVIIIQHAESLYSMYGHLAYEAEVTAGQEVVRGARIGAVLVRTDGRAPSHVHVEVRTFLTTPEVNGSSPRYGYGCGFECPPGPGYWPIDAPEHPSAMGWRNPTHVIARRMFAGGDPPGGMEVQVASTARDTTALWSAPPDDDGAAALGELALTPGARYPLHVVATGPQAPAGIGSERYRLWYRIALPEGDAWVQAAIPDDTDTGSDGKPSSVRFDFLPVVGGDEG